MKHPLSILPLILFFIPLIAYAQTWQEAFNQACDYFNQGNFSASYRLYQELSIQDPLNNELICNKALCLQKLCRLPEAQSCYEAVLAAKPDHGIALRGVSHVYLALGMYGKGWPTYEYRWRVPPSFNKQLKDYLEQGGNLQGKRILIHAEYGLGDTLQFVRYLQELKKRGAITILESQPSLIPLLHNCPYIDRLIPSGYECDHDFRVMLMSLPLVFNTTLTSIPTIIPYLYADQKLKTQWHQHLSPTTLNVGICWQTNIDTATPDPLVLYSATIRSIPYELIKSLTRIPNITLFCLQKITNQQERTTLTACGIRLGDASYDQEHGAFMDSAALITNLDLIISIDTATAHLAGGLGVPVWLLLPYTPDWRWMLDREDSPWYPTMRIFRQPKQHDWESVINKVIEELSKEKLRKNL